MTKSRRRHTPKNALLTLTVLACVATAWFATPPTGQAASWPARPVTIVVASQPGSAPDILARVVADPLGARLGQTVIVENRPGASGGIGAGFVARAKPDGHTLLMMTPVHSYTPAINPQTQFDPIKSFAPVTKLVSVPLIVVATPQTNATTLAEFVTYAKKQPGKLNYASPGSGSLQHLATVLFSKKAGIQMVHVPYKSGGDAVVSLLGNTSQLFFAGMPPALPHVKSGKLRALAVTTAQRSQSAKDVPTMEEAGYPGIEADNWHAIVATAGTPPDVVTRLEKEFEAVLGMSSVKEGFFNAGAETRFLSAKALGSLISGEAAKWTGAVKEAGVKASQ